MRLIPSLDNSRTLLEWNKTLEGQAFLSFSAGLILWTLGQPFWFIAAIAIFCTYRFPAQRKWIFSLAGISSLILSFSLDPTGHRKAINYIAPWEISAISLWVLVVTSLVMIYALLYILMLLREKIDWCRRHPVLSHLLLFAAFLLMFSYIPLPPSVLAPIWLFLLAWSQCLWYFNYTLVNPPAVTPTNVFFEFGFSRQFINTGYAPRGKSWRFMEKFFSSDANEFSQTQLKGLKLLLWAAALTILQNAWSYFFFKEGRFLLFETMSWTVELPSTKVAFYSAANNNPVVWYKAWLSLLLGFPVEVMDVAIPGHVAVACIRLMGFRIPRNTWRPLEALTLVDFWNRYYFYFKEILVDFFFYPTFARLKGFDTKTRTLLGTLAAAWLGNFIYHFFHYAGNILRFGFFKAGLFLHTFFFYAFVLSIGICISQWRLLNGRKMPSSTAGKLWARTCVFLFFALTFVFNGPWNTGDIRDNFKYILSLVGL